VQFQDKRGKNVGKYKAYKGKKIVSVSEPNATNVEQNKLQMSSKLKMGAWHPYENTFAVGKYNSLFIYTEKRQNTSKKE
jgi:hypothetical protein